MLLHGLKRGIRWFDISENGAKNDRSGTTPVSFSRQSVFVDEMAVGVDHGVGRKATDEIDLV
jgi:hypothetical protein